MPSCAVNFYDSPKNLTEAEKKYKMQPSKLTVEYLVGYNML